MITGKKILITGGAGFIGSNLCDYFIERKNTIICLDNLSTGKLSNIEHLLGRDDFKFIDCQRKENVQWTFLAPGKGCLAKVK